MQSAGPRRRAARDSPLAPSLADCLETAVHERREFTVIQRTVDIAVQGGRVARANFAPKVIADGTLLNFQQQSQNGHADLRLGFIRLDWTTFRRGQENRRGPRRRFPASARPWHRPSRSPIDRLSGQRGL